MNLLLELLFTIVISGILAVNTIAKTGRDLDELITTNMATYMRAVSVALTSYALNNRTLIANDTTGINPGLDLSNARRVPDPANAGRFIMNPDVTTLINAGFLPSNYPSIAPNGLPVFLLLGRDGGPPVTNSVTDPVTGQVTTITSSNCGNSLVSANTNCIVFGAVCTAAATPPATPIPASWASFSVRGASNILNADWLAAKIGGSGVVASMVRGRTVLGGPTYLQLNFLGGSLPPEGTVCALGIDGNASFVQKGDTRDPNLQGNMSVQGSMSVSGSLKINNPNQLLIADGASVPACIAPMVPVLAAPTGTPTGTRQLAFVCR